MKVLRISRKDFQSRALVPGITAGVIAALITISIEISLAALIWSGPLERYLPGGIGFMLFGAFIIGIVVALTSSIPGTVALPQDTPAALLALMAAGITSIMGSSSTQPVYATV